MFEDIRHELKKLKTEEKDLRKFGITMAIAFGLLSALAWFRHSGIFPYTFGLAGAFLAIGLAQPMILRQFYIGWMGFALVLGSIMTRVILTVLFFTGMTAIGMIRKIKHPDMLDEKYDPDAKTYWKRREQYPDVKRHLEQQF